MSAKMKKANSFNLTKQVKMEIQTATLGLKFAKAIQNYKLASGIAQDRRLTSNITLSYVGISDFSQFTQIDISNPPATEMLLVFVASMTIIVSIMYVFSIYCWNLL